MKKTLKTPVLAGSLLGCLMLCSILFSGCEDHEMCKKCSAQFAKEKRVKTISHYNASAVLSEKFSFFYEDNLVDSIVKISYAGMGARGDSTVVILKAYYPAGGCVPTSYSAKTYATGSPVAVEKAFMTISGAYIINKHLAFYPDEDFLVVDKTADIDYTYSGSHVATRKGTDYHILIYPNIYSNENFYTYTGNNITKIVAQKEQAGYDLNNVFDAKNNPFNIQGGVLYYLLLTSYPDEEYFETLCLNANNPTKMVYTGTDTSNSFVTITFTFTNLYGGAGYPTSVALFEAKVDPVHGNSNTDHGKYLFTYY